MTLTTTTCFDDPFVDATRPLILLDTSGFPAVYQRHLSWEFLAPNLDTSLWLHHFNPRCEWLLIDHECVVAQHGFMAVNDRGVRRSNSRLSPDRPQCHSVVRQLSLDDCGAIHCGSGSASLCDTG